MDVVKELYKYVLESKYDTKVKVDKRAFLELLKYKYIYGKKILPTMSR